MRRFIAWGHSDQIGEFNGLCICLQFLHPKNERGRQGRNLSYFPIVEIIKNGQEIPIPSLQDALASGLLGMEVTDSPPDYAIYKLAIGEEQYEFTTWKHNPAWTTFDSV